MADPQAARHWHILMDVFAGIAAEGPEFMRQHEVMNRATDKTERKEKKRARDTAESVNRNWAHGVGDRRLHASPVPALHGRLNPFYIAK